MTASSSSAPTSAVSLDVVFYPSYLFSRSPTFSSWARLTAHDLQHRLHSLPGFEGQNIWFFGNHPIRWVRIIGLVVSFDEFEKRFLLEGSALSAALCVNGGITADCDERS